MEIPNILPKHLPVNNKTHLSIFSLCILLCFAFLFTGCDPKKRAYEVVGLPQQKDIGSSLKLGIPVLILGFLLCIIAAKWMNKDEQSEKITFKTVIFFLGIATIVAGVVILFPVLLWIEAIMGGLMIFLGAIALAVILIVALVAFFRGN